MWPRPTFAPSGILIHQTVWTWTKNWGLCPLFGEGELGSHLAQCYLGYLHTKWRLDPFSHLATIDMGRKLGLCPFLGKGAGSPSNTMSHGLRPTSILGGILIQPAVWPQQAWAENVGAGSPCNTMWPGPRPTSMPSLILIHSTVWPQYTNVTD